MQAVQNELESLYHYTPQQIDNDGLHVVTTFSKSMMNQLYATVGQEERQMAAVGPGAALPRYAHVGAVLEDPSTGAILAMYSGPSYTRKGCHCQYDNALLSRNQVGSSFKTYVLATAVKQGMSVQTSLLNGDSPLQIPPDSSPT
ncbi:MAG: penicillin-binding transpeptidase domain-containing protein, partial [Streptosporangiaceae bacterium]